MGHYADAATRATYAATVTDTTQLTSVFADDEIMDFSSGRKSLKFRVDDDVFEASPDIAAELALRYADQAEQLTVENATNEQQIELIHALFRMVLLPESADRFLARLSDHARPIGNGKIERITRWLFEEYGLRPTTSDSASSTGSGNRDAGTSSTALTLAEGSTSDGFHSVSS